MKSNLYLGILAATCLGLGTVNAQPPTGKDSNTGLPTTLPTMPFDNAAPPSAPPPQSQQAPSSRGGINDYLAYLRPAGCCDGGGGGLIGSEAYVRYGASFPVGGGLFGRVLDPGFMIQGGVRSVFFRPSNDVAWTIDVGISSVWYDAGRDETANIRNFVPKPVFGQPTPAAIPEFPVTTSSLHQTLVHLALGQEYYLFGEANPADGGMKVRAGWDAGGRLGTQKLVLREIPHKTDTIGGMMGALHTDLEIPYGHCIFQAGVRAEFGYTWSNILQSQNDTDLATINVMFHTGIRF